MENRRVNDKRVRFRPSWDKHWFNYILQVKSMSTCIRREVACVFVGKNHHELATGFNGVPSGEPHCSELIFSDPRRCKADTVHGEDTLGGCKAIHAEINAMYKMEHMYIKDRRPHHDDMWPVSSETMTLYTTLMPCFNCALEIGLRLPGLLMIHALEDYESHKAKDVLQTAGINWKVWDSPPLT